MNTLDFTGLSVGITGGSQGIGAAITKAFYDAGANVFVGSRTNNGFAKTLGQRASHFELDVSKIANHVDFVNNIINTTGRLDIFINNAGFSKWRPLELIDENFWDTMMSTNLKGTFFGCQAASKHLKKNGCIINVSSIASKRGTSNNSVYCASKFGMNGITQALAKELGPRGIRVLAVCPVLVKTDGLKNALKEEYAPAYQKDVNQFFENFIQLNSALGRLPTAEEVANFCLFLASPMASALTGQCFNVDCGVFTQ